MSSSETQQDQEDFSPDKEEVDEEGKALAAAITDDEVESSEEDGEEEDDESEDEDETDEGEAEDEETCGADDDDEDDDGAEDSNSDEDEEEEDDDAEEEERAEGSGDSDASSGDENCDKCPICLNRLRTQDIGTPESCDHCFCLECIQEWAKNVNTCPVDRQVFRIILARHAGEEKIFKQFPVEDRRQEDEEVEEDPTFCEVCGQSDREDRLLLCDRCDLGYHCDCLDPPLASVPVHEWFCSDCQQGRAAAQSDPQPMGRQIARTRISERVRRLIAEARAERAERRRVVAAMIEAQEALENEGLTEEPSTSEKPTRQKAAVKKKRTVKKKRKTTRKRKTTKKRKTKRKAGGKKTKTKRRRKTKGRGKRKAKKTRTKSGLVSSPATLARTAISRSVTSVKGRIADKLGLSKPPAGRSIPLQKTVPARSEDFGASNFSILGSKDELYLFADQEGEERQPVNRPAISSEVLLSRSAKYSHRPLSFSLTKKRIHIGQTGTAPSAPATAATSSSSSSGAGFDLLGSIMQNQDLLYKGSKHITINRDGSLSAAKSATANQASTKPASKETPTTSTPSRDTHPLPSQAPATDSSEKKSQSKPLPSFNDRSRSCENQADFSTVVAEFSKATSSDEELLAESDEPTSVKNDSYSQSTTKAMQAEAYEAHSQLRTVTVNGSQNYHVSETAGKDKDIYSDEISHDYGEDIYSASGSSSSDSSDRQSITSENLPVLEADDKPSSIPEASPQAAGHDVSSNISKETRSSETDIVLRNGSNGDHTRAEHSDANNGDHARTDNSNANLEAAAFRNNAHLNSEDGARGTSLNLGPGVNSQQNQRHFAAVTSDFSTVPDDGSLGMMKRNFDLLVSTSSNLAGYESGEENNNLLLNDPVGREEGEASDSNDEGAARELEDPNRSPDDHEEGEIAEEDEQNRWTVSRNTCEEDHEDSGGLDVNAIHVEEMEIGTFRKRSMSQSDDNNEACKKMKRDNGVGEESETKPGDEENNDDVKESESEDESKKGKSMARLCSLASLLANLKSNVPDDQQEDQKQEEAETHREEKKSERENEEIKEISDSEKKAISILDFIGNASVQKFGLQMDDRSTDDKNMDDRSTGRGEYNQFRGQGNYGGGDGFQYRDSWQNGDRRRNYRQGGWRGDDGEENRGYNNRPYNNRRRGSWQDGDRGRHTSWSRDNQVSSQRSWSRDNQVGGQRSWSRDNQVSGQRSESLDNQVSSERSGSQDNQVSSERSGSQKHQDRDEEMGRRHRRRDDSRDRSRRSKSSSESPEKRGEKRKKSRERDEKSKERKEREKKSRWDDEEEKKSDTNDENSAKEEEDKDEKKKNGNDISTNSPASDGTPPPEPPKYRHSSRWYPHRPGAGGYHYQRGPMPSTPRPQAHNYPHARHPGVPFSHPRTHGQHPYPHGQLGHPAVPPPGFPPAFYPPPLSGAIPRLPPPPHHIYARPVYAEAAQYPSQAAADMMHLTTHIVAAAQQHSSYQGYSQHYPHPPPHPIYPQRAAVPSTTPAGYTQPAVPNTSPQAGYAQPAAVASSYPPQTQPSATAATTQAIHRYSYPGGAKQESAAAAHPLSSATTKPETTAPASAHSILAAQPESQKLREATKDMSLKDVKPVRASYRISSPTIPIKGVSTYDKVDSSILLNEVKKGFRQLVEDAVRSSLKGAWSTKKITKDEYKDILKRAVEKVCGSKETVIHQEKIQSLVNAYIIKTRRFRKPEQST